MTSDPVLALQAGASEDEAAAKATPGDGTATWRVASQRDDEGNVAGYSVISGPDDYVASAGGLGPVDGAGVVAHIARQDPRRTVARAHAYQAITAAYRDSCELHSKWGQGYHDALKFVIEQLAGAYEAAPEIAAKESDGGCTSVTAATGQ